MRRVLGILAVLFMSVFGAAKAQAGVDVRVDIAAQRMTVATTDGEIYDWKISSGRKGFRSPNGQYRPTRLEKNWYSRKYGGAMPYAVFFAAATRSMARRPSARSAARPLMAASACTPPMPPSCLRW